jgi:hypothetical protein
VRAHQRSGFISLSLGNRGAFSASLKRGTNVFPFSGHFNAAGISSNSVNGWFVHLELDLAGAQEIAGTVSANGWIADLLARRAAFNAQTNRATQFQGRYTVAIPGSTQPSASPAGFGYGAVTVGAGGNLAVQGTLADGQTWSQSVGLSRDGLWACYVPLYEGRGSVWSWMVFSTNLPSQEINGSFNWIKLPRTGAVYYPHGFTNDVMAQGSRYTAPTNATTRVIDVTNAIVVFEGGNLSASFTNHVTLKQNNEITNHSQNRITMSITRSNGLFSGSVKVPGIARTNTFKGAFLQDLDSGYGYFLGTNQSGGVFIGETP